MAHSPTLDPLEGGEGAVTCCWDSGQQLKPETVPALGKWSLGPAFSVPIFFQCIFKNFKIVVKYTEQKIDHFNCF